LVTAPGDGEVTVVADETLGEKDPLLARLLAAATAGAPPAVPATKRKPVRIVLDPDDRPVTKGFSARRLTRSTCMLPLASAPTTSRAASPCVATSCAHASLLANDRLHLLPTGAVRLDFKAAAKSHYIPWRDLLRRTFAIDIVCGKGHSPLRLIALIKTEAFAKKILAAMHLPTEIPQLHPARPPPRDVDGGEDWLN
jgi:hypothetical protein